MDFTEPFHVYASEDDWGSVWNRKVTWRERRNVAGEMVPSWQLFQNASHFLAGSLSRDGYRLFRNGGLPLLERQWNDWTAEILMRMGPNPVKGKWVPVTVDLHVSNFRLAGVRERYWRPGQVGLIAVARCNLGECSMPHGKIIVNLAHSRGMESLADAVYHLGLAWIDHLTDPPESATGFYEPARLLAQLELVLAYGGWGKAGHFLHSQLADHPEISQKVLKECELLKSNRRRWGWEADPTHNIALVASCYRLI